MVVMCLICLSRTCPYLEVGVPNALCDCDSLDDPWGWSYTCYIGSGALELLFSVEYEKNTDGKSTLKFECGINETNFEYLLQQIDRTNIQDYIFRACPLPNASYGGLFHMHDNDRPLQSIKIENTRDSRSFTAELFAPLSQSLQSLILINNGIRQLPESIFVNFSKLQYLSLSDDQIKTLPEKIFHPLPHLLRLEIVNNLLESLPENIFNNLFHLKYLFLYKNKLKELPNTIFKSLLNLQVLDLSNNQLLSMPPDIFMGLSQITNIRLRTLPEDLFTYTLNIREIHLNINRFMEPLPDTLLRGLTRLEKFSMQDCNISSLHETFFGYSPNITNLQLQYNRLKVLPEKIFFNNTMLKELNLNFNFIEVLQETLLINQKYLEKLSLYQNNITIIPENFFKYTISIKTLVLGRNNIQHFSKELFRFLPNLESIDLSENKLSNFMLDINIDIKYIFLSHNNFSSAPWLNYANHLKLETFDLEYNKIKYFQIPVLYNGNGKSPNINVAHNNITAIDLSDVFLYEKDIKYLPARDYDEIVETVVSLNSNPFVCDCKLYPLFEYLTRSIDAPKKTVKFSMIRNLICNEPPMFRNKPLLKMKAEQFNCDLKENCSSPCHCYYSVHDDSTVINCSNHQLKKLPHHMPLNTSVLYFNNNSLTSMAAFNTAEWANLTHAFLDNNQISSINERDIPPNLKSISLKSNRLWELPKSFLNLTHVKDEFRINLSGNPWSCNCSTSYFKSWLVENVQNVPDAKYVLCSQRLKQNGSLDRVSVLTVADDIMCPVNYWPYKVQIITVATICVLLTFFILVLLYYISQK